MVRSANGTPNVTDTCNENVSFAERTTTMVRSGNGTCVCEEHRQVPAIAVRTCSMVQEKRFVRGANNDYGPLRERNVRLSGTQTSSSRAVRTCLMTQERRFVRGANNDYGPLRERERASVRNTDKFLQAPYGPARWFRKNVSFAERTTTMVSLRERNVCLSRTQTRSCERRTDMLDDSGKTFRSRSEQRLFVPVTISSWPFSARRGVGVRSRMADCRRPSGVRRRSPGLPSADDPTPRAIP